MPSLENFRLTVFRTVAAQLSFRKAAEELYLSQPAVSLQIKALEEELGLPLFDRSGTHISLTPAGELLLEAANQSSALLGSAAERMAALTGELAGELALGASTTIAQYLLPRLLSQFARSHPRLRLTLISGNTEAIVAALESQRIGLGLIEGPSRSREVRTEAFLDDELVLIAPAASEWAESRLIPAAELARAPLLMREHGSGTRRVVELALERLGVRLSPAHIPMELDSTEAIKSAVEAGLGLGFVSRWALAKDLRLGANFVVVEVEKLRIRRQFLLTSPAGPAPAGAAAEFRRFLFAHAGDERLRPRRPAKT